MISPMVTWLPITHFEAGEKVYVKATTPVQVSVRNQHSASRYTVSKRILFLFICPNAAGLHHLWVCKLTIMFCLQARKLPWTLSVIVKVFCFHSQATSEFKWIVLLLLWKVKLPEAWRKLDLITFQKMLISTGRQTHSGTFYLIIQFRSR